MPPTFPSFARNSSMILVFQSRRSLIVSPLSLVADDQYGFAEVVEALGEPLGERRFDPPLKPAPELVAQHLPEEPAFRRDLPATQVVLDGRIDVVRPLLDPDVAQPRVVQGLLGPILVREQFLPRQRAVARIAQDLVLDEL